MNQKLASIKQILTSLEKDRELSFSKFSKIFVSDSMNEDDYWKTREKYENIHLLLKGVVIFTSFGNKNIDYLIKKNLYKVDKGIAQWYKNYIWGSNINGKELYTIFKIESGKDFIQSLLLYVDEIKQKELVTLSTSKQKEIIQKQINSSQEKFGKENFEISFSLKEYFENNIEYLTIIQNEDLKIKNIIIFESKIRFILRKENTIQQDSKQEFTFEIIPYYGVLRYGEKEYKFKKGKNTYLALVETLNRDKGEVIDFIDMVSIFTGKESKDKMKMVYNAVDYLNKKVLKEFNISNFVLVEEKACSRQYLVNGK